MNALKSFPTTSIRHPMKKRILLASTLILFLVQGKALANCQWGVPGALIVGVNTNIAIPQNTSAGTALAPWNDVSSIATGSCSPATRLQATIAEANWLPVGTYVEAGQTYSLFRSNIPGIGFVLAGAVITQSGLTAWVPIVGQQTTTVFEGNVTSLTQQVRIRLVATGAMSPGSYRLDLGQIGSANVFGPPGQNAPARNIIAPSSGGNIVILAITCSLSTSSATFNMGTVAREVFTGVGNVQPWVADQSLVSGGCNARAVSMTFAGTAAPAPHASAFANGGTAKGVALELWQASGSQAIPNGGAINFAPQGAGGRYTFSARYRQIDPVVTAGSVSANVTVTVNYQ